MPTTSATYLSWVRVARIARRLTQGELAALAGLSRKAVVSIENDPDRRPHEATKQALALALGFDVAELFPTGKQCNLTLVEWDRAIQGDHA
ncbi:MAG TPA: helix-turn-helix transcriptional regulator [Baekduia sp.]|nr:helix-turn-helix transcriptional regulator [Baekduia sp.]